MNDNQTNQQPPQGTIPQTPPQPGYPQSYPPPYQGQPYQYPVPPKPIEQPYRWDYNNFGGGEPPQKKPNKGLIAFLVVLACCLVIGITTASVISLWGSGLAAPVEPSTSESSEAPSSAASSQPSSVPESSSRAPLVIPPSGELLTIPQVAAKVTPSVVGILRYENTLYDPTGMGSGFIVDVDDEGYAYIITNAHVVEFGTNFQIRLWDGEELDAKLVGTDELADIAVLRAKTSGEVTVAEVGNSDDLLVGETVVAIGNPVSFELSGSVTQGIVSALDRKLSTDNAINYIQIDAAINPGNSGGALVNQYGQVVGINTMKISGTGLEGIGFAIPMAYAMPIVEELRENGKITSRPVLGIGGVEITETEARRLNCPVGIMVMEVQPNAETDPELKPEDIITHANGKRILGLSDLRAVLNDYKVGDEIELTVYRKIDTVDSEELTIKVILISSES